MRLIVIGAIVAALLCACGGQEEGFFPSSPVLSGKGETLPDDLPVPTIESMEMEVVCESSLPCMPFGVEVCNHHDRPSIATQVHLFFDEAIDTFSKKLRSIELPKANYVGDIQSLDPGDCFGVGVDLNSLKYRRMQLASGNHVAWAVMVLPPRYVLSNPWMMVYDAEHNRNAQGVPFSLDHME